MNSPPTKRPRRSQGGITLRDVARLAGVAPITASRALNTPDQVSAELLQRVRAAVEQTGYVPNRMAGGLASARSRLIAAIVPNLVGSVFGETIEALNDSLFDAGYQLMLGQTGYADDRQLALLEAVIGRRPDGIVVTGVVPPGPGRQRLIAAGIPVVETWDLADDPIDMLIGFSHDAIGRDVANYLMDKGHKRLAVVQAADQRAARRTASFVAAVQARTPDGGAARHASGAQGGRELVCVDDVGQQRSLAGGRAALARILAAQPDIDAVFCSSDLLALGVLMECAARGIQVPQQIAVIGFGDMPMLAQAQPALSSVRINGGQIGHLAAQMLIARARGLPVGATSVDVGFSLALRGSA